MTIAASAFATFCERYKLIHFAPGQTVIEAGDEPTDIYFIIAGRVEQTDITSTGDHICLNVYGPGAFLSLTWLFQTTVSRSYYRALGDVKVHRVPVADVREFLHEHPQEALLILQRLARGLDGYINRLRIHLTEKAAPRVALEILTELRRFPPPASAEQPVIRLTVQELASRCGLARETTSRQLAEFVAHGIVAKRRGSIIIHDRLALEEVAGS